MQTFGPAVQVLSRCRYWIETPKLNTVRLMYLNRKENNDSLEIKYESTEII